MQLLPSEKGLGGRGNRRLDAPYHHHPFVMVASSEATRSVVARVKVPDTNALVIELSALALCEAMPRLLCLTAFVNCASFLRRGGEGKILA